VGDVHDVALRDRRRLSEDGVLIIVATLASSDGGAAGPPELIARGFGDGSGPLLDELRDEADRVLQDCLRNDIIEIKLLQEHLHDELGQLVYDRTRRRPMILPVVVEV
jgi:ribonuclease J